MNLSAVNRSVLLLSRLFDPNRTIQPFLPMTVGKPVFQTQHTRFFPRVTAEEEGVSSAQLAALLQTLSDHPQLRMHTMTVLRHGHVICEAGFGAYDAAMPQYVYSACKSIVSLAVGILCGSGALSTDDKLIDLFPDRVSAVSRLRLANLRVEDLLTMRSGIIFNELESQTDEDWINCYLNSALTAEPGQVFAYNSLNTYMLAAIVTRKTGKTLTAFLKEQLFDALDIRDFFWEVCPRGIEKGGWGLYLRSEDLAKLGMLVLRGGVWNGTRLIPEDYLARAASPIVSTPAETGRYDYGYQMWVGTQPRAFLFNGMFGQNVLGFPDTDVLIVSTAGNDELFQQSPYYDIVTEALGNPARLSDTPLPADPAAENALRTARLLCADHTPEMLRTQTSDAPRQVPRQAPLQTQSRKPPSLLSRLSSLIGRQETPLPAAPPSADTEKPKNPPLPSSAALFLDKTFSVREGESASAVGLLPMAIQTVQSNYAQGFVSVSFARAVENGEERFLITYREADDTHIFSAGTQLATRTTLYFHGIPYTAAAKVSFPTDEDGRQVCRIRVDFIETPHTRILKLFLNPDGTCLLRQEELPGAALVSRAVLAQKSSLTEQPVIGAAMEKIDNDYLSYRIRRTFAPELTLKIN